MNHLIEKRLDLVGSSAGSIVSVATWCSLHAPDSEAILKCISDRIASPASEDTVRASLLYVVHEILLNCSSKGTPESAKRTVLQAVGRQLPPALEKLAQEQKVPRANLTLALSKVLEWWKVLSLFPENWFTKMKDILSRLESPAVDLAVGDKGIPASIALLHSSLSRYEDARRQYNTVLEHHKEGADPSQCLRLLANLRKTAEVVLEKGSHRLLLWCDQEKARLTGTAIPEAPTDSLEPLEKRVKQENASPPPEVEEEDILGSFYS